jgi:subtilisin-like proprotein convertase family protein
VVFAMLAPLPATAGAATTFENPAAITIPDSGNASLYPTTVAVTGMRGPVADVDVVLDNISHGFPDDLDILLVSPQGTKVELMSDVCGGGGVTGLDWRFSDGSAAMPDSGPCGAGTFRPSSGPSVPDTWPAAFPPPHATTLAALNGENANGSWQLFVRDDAGGGSGSIDNGWRLDIDVGPRAVSIPAGAGATSGPGTPYPHTVQVAGREPIITDVDVVLDGLGHEHPDDLDVVVQGPGGQTVMLMSDSCGSTNLSNVTFRFDDEAPVTLADSDPCSTTVRPNNLGGIENLPAPAPQGPYGAGLGVFDGTDPNGTWRLFVADDAGGDEGFIARPMRLEISTRPGAAPPAPAVSGGPAAPGGGAPIVPGPPATSASRVKALTEAGTFRLPSTRSCKRRRTRLTFTPKEPNGVQFQRTELLVNGKRQNLLQGSKADDPVRVRMRGSRLRITIKLTVADGRKLTIRRSYRACARRR